MTEAAVRGIVSKMRRRLLPCGPPLLSGLLIGTSYIPFPPWALLFCFVPIWRYWLRAESWRQIAWGAWLSQFVFCLVGFHWVAYTAHEFGRMPWPAAIGVLLLFGAFGHLFLVLAGLLFAVLRSRLGLSGWGQRLLLPCVTALCWRYVPMIFPWNLGYPWLGARLPAFQLAEFVGFEGLAAVTLFLNLALLLAWERRKERAGAYLLAGAAGILLLLNGAGWVAAKAQPAPDAVARVLVVQGDIGNPEKISAETDEDVREAILLRYFRLTRQALGQGGGRPTNFTVWPETAFVDFLGPRPEYAGDAGTLLAFVRSTATPLATGAFGYDEESGRESNSMFFIGRDGAMSDRPYAKTRLLIFGEYVPLSGTFPVLRRWFPWAGNFKRGPGPSVRRIGGVRVGPQICYEGLFPAFSRGLAERGAQLFVNITNDSWFGSDAEPYQHLYMTLARGVEFRRPVVRATNTGISAALEADGTVLDPSPLNAEWAHTYEIRYRKSPSPTFYQGYGFHLIPALLWLSTAAVLAFGRTPRGARKEA
jgi:apolipoprotein N-acyltransferase